MNTVSKLAISIACGIGVACGFERMIPVFSQPGHTLKTLWDIVYGAGTLASGNPHQPSFVMMATVLILAATIASYAVLCLACWLMKKRGRAG